MKKHTNHNERLSGVSRKKKVNNSIAATEIMKICTQIYGRTLIVLFVVCFSIHTRTNDNIQRQKIITRREETYIHTQTNKLW
jgi:hypothetical protein